MEPDPFANANCPLSANMSIDELDPQQREIWNAHRLGHIIDQLAGPISVIGLEEELQGIYNTLNNPDRADDGRNAASAAKLFGPQDRGLTGEAVAREYIAEAIRAYLTDPNYIKSVAPNTAAAIRAAVNPNPSLNRMIQFN